MARVKTSYGRTHVNHGKMLEYDETKPYQLDMSRSFYLFDIVPISAPRMTQSDKWKLDPNHPDINKRQRVVIKNYFAYKKTLKMQAKILEYNVSPCLDILFLMPMPNSWSNKKKKEMNGLPCKVKPDTDNLVKAFKDALCENDSFIWREISEKRWAYFGSIIVFA
jgi:Holliday junction resolvase RusA-like endonuclease